MPKEIEIDIDTLILKARSITRMQHYHDDDVKADNGTIVLQPNENILTNDGINFIADFTPDRNIKQYLTQYAKTLLLGGDIVFLVLPNGYYKLLKSRR